MDTTGRKGDVIITRGDTVTNSRDGGEGGGGGGKSETGQKMETGDTATTHKHILSSS